MGNTTFLTNCSAWLYSDPSQDTHPAPKAPEDTTPIEPTTETPKPSKPKYDFSTFQRQKIKRLHGLLDADSDGIISEKDLRKLGKRMGKKSKKTDEYEKHWITVFEKLFREQFDNKTQDITYKNWIDGLELIATENTKEEKEKITFTMFEPLFKAIDADKNNSINLKEYMAFCKLFGYEPYDISQTFRNFGKDKIDANEDNKLDQDEFCNACVGYIWDRERGTGTEHVFGQFPKNEIN